MSARAHTIYTTVLDALTDCIVAGDARGALEYLSLPFAMHLLDGTHVCTNAADVANLIQQYSQRLTHQGVTELRRRVDDARFLTETRIEGFHITEPLRDGTAVAPAYAIRSVLELQNGRWRSTEQDCIVTNSDWPIFPEVRSPQDQPGYRHQTANGRPDIRRAV